MFRSNERSKKILEKVNDIADMKELDVVIGSDATQD